MHFLLYHRVSARHLTCLLISHVTVIDPLAQKIRWKLKKHGVAAEDVMSVFSVEKPVCELLPLDEEQRQAPQVILQYYLGISLYQLLLLCRFLMHCSTLVPLCHVLIASGSGYCTESIKFEPFV